MRIVQAAVLTLSVVLSCGAAAAQASRVNLNIKAQPVRAALKDLGEQTGLQILFRSEDVAREGITTPPLSGEWSAAEALERLLANSGLRYKFVNPRTVLVSTQEDVQSSQLERVGDLRVAWVADREAPEQRNPPSENKVGQDAQEIVVTGTNIKGIAPESSPVHVYGREEIRRTGVSSTEQFIRTLPQNAGGGSSEFAPRGLPNDANSTQNNTFGTSANLRGLGSRGTLVLLNGNRMAPTSKIGDFVDISLIPLSALERVEVLTDGASSIYGGDAVAGVINFVLRDDFQGSETSLRYGAVTRGHLDEYRVSQTLGTGWSRGNILATYEYLDRGNLLLSDRPEIDPPLFTGTNNRVTDTDSIDLLPGQQRHSAVVSLRQSAGSKLDTSSTFLYSGRNASADYLLPSGAGVPLRSDSKSESISGSVGLDYELSSVWAASLLGNYGQIRNREIFTGFSTNPPSITQTVSESDLWSVDARLNGDLVDLPGGAIKIAAGGHFRREDFLNQLVGRDPSRLGRRDVASVYGELFVPLVGARNAFPAVERLEVNVSGRLDDYSDFGSAISPKVGVMWSPKAGLRFRGSYSRSFAPPSLGRTGALDRTGSVRPYQFILNALGLPLPDPSLAGVDYLILGGTASNLRPEKSRAFTAGAEYTLDRNAGSLTLGAGYYDIRFEGRLGNTPMPGNVNINLAPSLAFADPSVFPPGTVLFFPSRGEVDQIISTFVNPPSLSNGGRVENIGIVNAVNVTRNLSLTRTSGIDLNIKYKMDTTFGSLSAGVNANYILDFLEQASVATPQVGILSTLFNPVDLKLRANLSLSSGGLSGSLFVNYTDSYATDSTVAARPIDAWTTFDLALSYELGESFNRLEGAAIGLSVSNLFDAKAPRTTSGFGPLLISGYDPANASPLGRFIAVDLRKSF